jgi:hypothetical protein
MSACAAMRGIGKGRLFERLVCDHHARWRCQHEAEHQEDFLSHQNDKWMLELVGKFDFLAEDIENGCSRLRMEVGLPLLNSADLKKTYHSYD